MLWLFVKENILRTKVAHGWEKRDYNETLHQDQENIFEGHHLGLQFKINEITEA